MSILVNNDTRLIVQGITGKEGAFHTEQMVDYGTNVVGGVTPGKGGQQDANGLPIFNTVADAVKVTNANTDTIPKPNKNIPTPSAMKVTQKNKKAVKIHKNRELFEF